MTIVRYNGKWWQLELPEHIDLLLPGIYEWRIGEESLYIGKSSRLHGRLREYPNNIRKMLEGRPYRKSGPGEYRAVHYELRKAYDSCTRVTVTILENCEQTYLNERERYWIETRIAEAEQGGPRVLNATIKGG